MEIAGIAGEITVFSDRAGESRPARNRRRVPDPGDLRRRSETGREAAQRCLDRADVLPSADRALVVAVFRDGVSVHRLALLDDAPDVPQRAKREWAMGGDRACKSLTYKGLGRVRVCRDQNGNGEH